MEKRRNIPFVITGLLIIIVAAGLLFVSPLTTYLVRRSAERLTGRKITMDHLSLNPITGTVLISKLRIYEKDSDSIFFSSENIYGNINMIKLLSKTVEIRSLFLYRPRGIIDQNKKEFNFNSLIDKFSPGTNSDTLKTPGHFSILSLKIVDGQFFYREHSIPVNYSIKKVNIESSGIRWDSDTINARFSFLPGTGTGDMKGEFTINKKNSNYRLALKADKYDLNIIQQYLKDMVSYGSFSGNIDASIKAKGNLLDQEDLDASGRLAINDLHFGKNPKTDFASFDKLEMVIKELNPKNLKYLYDSITLVHPCVTYELYDYLDNMQTMFGEKGSNISAANARSGNFNLIIDIARYVKVLANSFFKSDYKINRLRIYRGDLKFNDYSTSEKFSVELNPLTFKADSIDKNHARVDVLLHSSVRPYGNILVNVSINPKDSTDFDMQYHFKKLPVSMFNPYIITFTSFPLDRGTLEFNGSWKVRNGLIKSINHLVIIDPRTSKRIRNKDTKWVPLPLVMTFIRERGNVIDYEIPITGNLKDPKFHLKYVILDLLRNIFVKPPTTPYRLQVKNVENEIEKSITLKWEMRQSSLSPSQEKFIEKMSDFINKTPEASINVFPQHYELKEKEYILYFEAKKKYFLSANNINERSFTKEDSAKVDNMSVKDSLFVNYLNTHVKDSLIFTINEKCARMVDSSLVSLKFRQLNIEREKAFIKNFTKRNVNDRVKISTGVNVVPYNGFSFYRIEYAGKFPEALFKAYEQMNELNNEAPRKKFKQERKSIKTINSNN